MEYLNEQTKLEHPECRCDTPNNIGASNIRPNTPDPNIACPTPICPNPMRLWVIKYAITGTAKFIGQAIVQAPTIEQAQCIFGKDSRFNGYVDRLKITCCHEVFPHPEPILLQEDCVAIIDRRNLKTYPFVLKSDFSETISDLYANIAKAIRDSWEKYRREFKVEVYNGLQGDNYINIEVTEDYEQCYITHADSGVTAGEYGDVLEEQQKSKTPDFGESVKIMSLIVDSQGHITEIEDHLVTIPTTEATQSLHGLMSASDKQKLDEIGIDTTNTTALTPANELFDSVTNNNVIQLHKISKTGTFSDLLSIPDGILTINYPKGDGTTETKTFTDNADTNETVTIPSEIDDTLAQDYKTYSSNKIEDLVNNRLSQLETNIDWKETVNTYADIATTYSNPQNGWTVNVKDTDYTYRYNGTEWVAISANAIPLATHSVNGLMSATDKTKLDGIETGAEVNVQPDWNQGNINADDYIKNKPIIPTITFRQWQTE